MLQKIMWQERHGPQAIVFQSAHLKLDGVSCLESSMNHLFMSSRSVNHLAHQRAPFCPCTTIGGHANVQTWQGYRARKCLPFLRWWQLFQDLCNAGMSNREHGSHEKSQGRAVRSRLSSRSFSLFISLFLKHLKHSYHPTLPYMHMTSFYIN